MFSGMQLIVEGNQGIKQQQACRKRTYSCSAAHSGTQGPFPDTHGSSKRSAIQVSMVPSSTQAVS